jgi:hypothetical protein
MGRRRQGDTGPDRSDDSNRALDRTLDGDPDADTDYERGKEAGAYGVTSPHAPVSPGTRRALEDARARPAPKPADD